MVQYMYVRGDDLIVDTNTMEEENVTPEVEVEEAEAEEVEEAPEEEASEE